MPATERPGSRSRCEPSHGVPLRVPIDAEPDIVTARQRVRAWALETGFSLVDQTKIVTAASELARNTLIHGGGGTLTLEALGDGARRGLRLVHEDQGPGIPDVALALQDGYTTGGGLGLGLGGAKRLVNDFRIDSRPGEDTRVTLTRWRQPPQHPSPMRETLVIPVTEPSQVGEARRGGPGGPPRLHGVGACEVRQHYPQAC